MHAVRYAVRSDLRKGLVSKPASGLRQGSGSHIHTLRTADGRGPRGARAARAAAGRPRLHAFLARWRCVKDAGVTAGSRERAPSEPF